MTELFDFNDLPTPAYLVGGWVRDRLLNRQGKYLDLDFVLPDKVMETAQKIARKYKAGFVLLDAERQIARVVFKNGTADFAQQMGNSLEEDLGRRDFCLNAIAIECHQIQSIQSPIDREICIDPFDGMGDLAAKRIRMVAPENLAEDPLRILRGYRQAAQLDFEIESLTREVLIKLSPRLKSTAAERVRTELGYLLSIINKSQWMLKLIDDHILDNWIPRQHLNLDRFNRIENAITRMIGTYSNLEPFFNKQLSGDRSALVIIKLASLSNSANALDSLALSRIEQRWLIGILRYLPQFTAIFDSASLKEQYKFFQPTLEFFPAIVALALASGCAFEKISPWVERWLNPNDLIAYPVALINGDDLRKDLGIEPSPKIGELLESVKIAQVQGFINSREEAIAFIKKIL